MTDDNDLDPVPGVDEWGPRMLAAFWFVVLCIAVIELLWTVKIVRAADEPRYPRALFFHAEKWCQPCEAALHGPRNFPDWLRPAGWQIDGTNRAHVQLIDIDQRHDLVEIHGVTTIPAIVVVDGKTIRKAVPYVRREQIPEAFK